MPITQAVPGERWTLGFPVLTHSGEPASIPVWMSLTISSLLKTRLFLAGQRDEFPRIGDCGGRAQGNGGLYAWG
jgi:hypothetical protein